MQEGESGEIKLPEDERNTVEELLGFLYFGKAALDKYDDMQKLATNATQYDSLWQKLHRLYILADKVQFDELHNSIMDLHHKKEKTQVVPTGYLSRLQTDLSNNAPLVRFWIQATAASLYRKNGFFEEETHALRENAVLAWVQAGGSAVEEVFRHMVKRETLVHPSKEPRCKWHIHQRTPKCDG